LKTLIITQARIASTRLPSKVLLQIGSATLLDYHLERLSKSLIPTYVATSISPSDDILCAHLDSVNTPYFRGSEVDVLSRFYECALQNHADVIIRVTSDCPLIDGELIKYAHSIYLERNNQSLYLSNTSKRTYPRGFDFEIFSFAMLEQSFYQTQLASDREHVTTYIRRNCPNLYINEDIVFTRDASHLRLTVDEPEDFQLMKSLIIDYQLHTQSARDIINFLEDHPELVEINKSIEQKKSLGST
jgi:spore coat polysaccharide biosynthesis protein SpsF